MDTLEQLAALVASSDPPDRGARILAAVSGGADSVALLHLLVRLAGERGWTVTAAHLDHGLRGEAGAADRSFVHDLARDLGLEAVSARQPVDPGPGISCEEAARQVRRSFLTGAARDTGASRVALGHNADDLAETVLLRLVRGTGPGGLAAMTVRDGPWWRPLLGAGREEIRRALTAAGLAWREDETNRDIRFDRNRLRAEVMPVLRALNPRAVEAIGRLARLTGRDESLLRSLARQALGKIRRPSPAGGTMALDESALTELHPALAGRVVHLALGSLREDRRGPSHRLVAAVLDLAGQPTGRQVELPGGGIARIERGHIVLRPTVPSAPPPVTLTPPGRVAWGRLGHLSARLLAGPDVPSRPAAACGPRRALLDPERATGPLQVRGASPGDRFHPLGGPGERLLADFLRDAGVAAPDRATVPLLICAGRIAWVAGHRIDERYRLADKARTALELVWEPAS